jgi:hypothetical protein
MLIGLGSIVEVTQGEVAVTSAETRLAKTFCDDKTAESALASAVRENVKLSHRPRNKASCERKSVRSSRAVQTLTTLGRHDQVCLLMASLACVRLCVLHLVESQSSNFISLPEP